ATVCPADGIPATVCPADGIPATVCPADGIPATVCPADGIPATICPADAIPATVCPADGIPATICLADAIPAAVCPTDAIPATGEPKGRAVGRSQDNTGAKTDHPPTRPAEEVVARVQKVTPGQVSAPLVERGAQALAALSHTERRLRLTGSDVRALAPLAGEWLLRGATLRHLRDDLTAGLPERVHSAAGLLRDRLLRKMPEPPSFAEQEPVACAAPRAADMRECQGGHTQPRLFTPVAGERLCPACRQDRAEAAQDASGAIQATLRGAAAVRVALRGGVAG
ncbi:hypothetical protein AB0902_14985, partial [Streptomyces syringium]